MAQRATTGAAAQAERHAMQAETHAAAADAANADGRAAIRAAAQARKNANAAWANEATTDAAGNPTSNHAPTRAKRARECAARADDRAAASRGEEPTTAAGKRARAWREAQRSTARWHKDQIRADDAEWGEGDEERRRRHDTADGNQQTGGVGWRDVETATSSLVLTPTRSRKSTTST